jgi:hypothetical protein
VAKAPGRKLKVFQAQFGFYDTVVAAPSQAAALRAWGTHQNLFASGEATLTTDEAAIRAAIAHPETPLRRAVGSTDAFALEPTSLPKVPNVPKTAATKPAVKPKPAAPPRPAADRSKLDSAETALGQLDDRRKNGRRRRSGRRRMSWRRAAPPRRRTMSRRAKPRRPRWSTPAPTTGRPAGRTDVS